MSLQLQLATWSLGVRILFVSCLALLAGCGGERRLDVSVVRGRVSYQGQGVPKATVIFHPQGEAAEKLGKMRPFAYTDDDGNFQIKTYVEGDGAPAGDYRVSIVAPAKRPPGGGVKDVVREEPVVEPTVALPPPLCQKYLNVDTAGISVTVKEGENELAPFEL
jgi:hypothetical protein